MISGAIVSVYNAGQSIGGLSTGFLADKFSRKYTIFIAAFLSMFPPLPQVEEMSHPRHD